MRVALIVCLSLLLLPVSVRADVVALKNGDRISGQITEQGRGGIRFKPDFGGDLAFPWSMIASVHNTKEDKTTLPPPVAAVETPSVVAPLPEPAPEPTVVAKKMVAPPAVKEPEKKTKTSKGEVNVGLEYDSGNSSTRQYTITGKWETKRGKNRFTVEGSAEQEKDGDTTEEAKAEIDFEYDRFLTQKWFWENNLGFEHDDNEGLKLRTQAGTGPGYQFFEGDRLNLAVTLGGNYIHDDLGDSGAEETFSGRWALDYDQKIYKDKLKAFHSHEAFLSVEDTEDMLFESVTGLKVLLSQHVTGTGQVEFDYDNLPAPGVGNSDTTYKFLLGYAW